MNNTINISDYDKIIEKNYPSEYYPKDKSRLYSKHGWQKLNFNSIEYKKGYEWFIEFEDYLDGFIKILSIWGKRPRYIKIIIEFDLNLDDIIEYFAEIGISEMGIRKYYNSAVQFNNHIIIEEFSNIEFNCSVPLQPNQQGSVCNEKLQLQSDNNVEPVLRLCRISKDYKKLIKMIFFNNEIYLANRGYTKEQKEEEFLNFENMCFSGTWNWDKISWKNEIYNINNEIDKLKHKKEKEIEDKSIKQKLENSNQKEINKIKSNKNFNLTLNLFNVSKLTENEIVETSYKTKEYSNNIKHSPRRTNSLQNCYTSFDEQIQAYEKIEKNKKEKSKKSGSFIGSNWFKNEKK